MSNREFRRPLRRRSQKNLSPVTVLFYAFRVFVKNDKLLLFLFFSSRLLSQISAISTNFCIFLSDLYQPRVLLTRTENQDIFIFGGYFLHSNNPHVLAFYMVDTCILA